MGLSNFPNGLTSFGSVVHGGSSPALGREFHVRKTADAGYEKWKEQMNHTVRGGGNSVHTTIEAAVAAADDFDTIWVYPGEWIPSGTLTIDQKHLKILAADMGSNCGLSGTEIWQYYYGTNVPIFTLNGANNVEIAGFRLIPYNSATGLGISIGETTECKGTWIHDNILYAVETGTGPTHIRMGASGVDAQYTLIENNYIYCGGNTGGPSGMIDWVQATRAMIRNNNFMVQSNSATMSGIYLTDAAYIRGHILNNTFVAMEQSLTGSSSYAILTAGALVGGDMCITGNQTVNFTAPFSDVSIEALGINYNGDDAINAA